MEKNILILISLFLTGQILFAQQPSNQIDGAIIQKTIQSINTSIQQNYVYPDKALLIVDFLNSQYKSGKYNQLTSPKDFADKVTTDIRSIQNDQHLRIEYNPKLEQDIIRFNNSQENKNEITQTDISKEKLQNFYFKKLEILPSNIGYIEFTNFALPSDEAQKTIQSAMQFVSSTDALIIDLRSNRGGSGKSNNILGYFFKEKTKTGRSFNRITNTWTENFVEPAEFYLDIPVYVLTSKRTFSAAEGFAYTLQNQHNTTIVGTPTNGGAHLTRSFSLGNGFVGFIPYLRSENEKTHTDWEGTGVIPDISTTAENALLSAQNEILKTKLEKATEKEKRKIQWLINYNQSLISDVLLDSMTLDKFIGRYAEFEITEQNNSLYFRDVNQKDKTPFPMTPISQTLFQIGGDYQVEFINESDGKFQSINMSWSDGWTEIINRNP
ncbi:MAG TPA: S41 family peptidase [Flavobacteriaceae bacterium]